ncbi:MAG: hypothetical protein K6B54_00135 [Clostridia bacterium]|nr:hypothetical protein [Clostridia bacterium]
MKYTYSVEEYARQLREYNELENMRFSPEDGKDFVVSKLEERSAKKLLIAEIANTMIREYIETFEKEPGAMTPEDAAKLQEFLATLMPSGVHLADFVTDYGIMLRIAKLLSEYYERQGDTESYAFALQKCCVAYQMLVNQHSYYIRDLPYVEKIRALAEKMDQGGIGGNARLLVLKMLVYMVISGPESFSVERYRYIREKLTANMSCPLDATEERLLFSYNVNVLEVFNSHCLYARRHGFEVDMEAAGPFVGEILAWLKERREEAKSFGFVVNNFRYLLLTAEYHLGRITLDGLLEGLTGIQKDASESENPVEQANGLAEVNYAYVTFLFLYSPLPKEEIVRRGRERVREVLPKLMEVSRAVNNIQFNRCIVLFLGAASLTGSFDEFADIILETTVYADKVLYIHTAMVREISRTIFDEMIEKTPRAFDGVANRDADYITKHKDEMRELLSDCCMFHDIGKFFMLDVVENSMRRLTEDEFSLIKEHPGHFEHIYQAVNGMDERVKCIRDCALMHHLWHDGTHGYPAAKPTKNRPFADILAIADSLDAATDYLGRPYNEGKTIDELIAEIQSAAGTQYGAEAAKALSSKKVRDRISLLITEGRKDVYYQIYAFNKL